MARGPAGAGEPVHGHRSRPSRSRRVRQAARRLLPRRPRQRAARPHDRPRRSSGRPSSASRSAAASRCSSPTSTPSAASDSCSSRAAASAPRCRGCCGRSRCPGAEYLMPVLFPSFVAGRRQRRRPTPRPARVPSATSRAGVAGLRVAHRARQPAVVHPHPAGRGRPARPDRQRPRPALPRVAVADADRVGRARPHHPGRPRRRRRTRRSPAAGW